MKSKWLLLWPAFLFICNVIYVFTGNTVWIPMDAYSPRVFLLILFDISGIITVFVVLGAFS